MNMSEVTFWEPPFSHGTTVAGPMTFYAACDTLRQMAKDFAAKHDAKVIPTGWPAGATLYIRREHEDIARFEVNFPLC